MKLRIRIVPDTTQWYLSGFWIPLYCMTGSVCMLRFRLFLGQCRIATVWIGVLQESYYLEVILQYLYIYNLILIFGPVTCECTAMDTESYISPLGRLNVFSVITSILIICILTVIKLSNLEM